MIIKSTEINNRIVYILIIVMCFGCVEEIDLLTETDFESALVIEATITNELKQQKILLSRTFRLEEEGPSPESHATVNVIGSDGIIHNFQELESGVYLSSVAFEAKPNIDYHLEVKTTNGSMYSSSVKQLTQQTQIDDLYVERGFNENGDEGISIFLDTFDPSDNSKHYRFEYEETYKVIVPYYSPLELVPNDITFPFTLVSLGSLNGEEITDFFVELKPREEQKQVCYNTVISNTIIIGNTVGLLEDRLDKFRIRFVNRNNAIISHRYSILVRQYVQSQEAYVFYEALNEFSEFGNLFSQIQPGFLEGNVFSVTNQKERVIGFFEISSVDEQRIFFNYDDLFSGEQLPPYYISCDDFFSPLLLIEDLQHNIIGSPLIDALNSGQQFFLVNENPNPNLFLFGPFILVLEPCGDCTVLGDNVVPAFWED